MTGSSFSVATTVFVSLAICAVISYGIFYYFKQRLSLIEKSQMEQARIMQALISHGLLQPQGNQNQQQGQQPQGNQNQQQQQQQGQQGQQLAQCKEITITHKGLIEVSSDDDSSDDSDSKSSDSDSSDSSTESSSNDEVPHNAANDDDKWSIGDEIHQPDSYHEEFEETFRKNVLIDAISIDSSYVVDNVIVENSNKKIISLKESLNHDAELSDAESESSSSSSSSSPSEKHEEHEDHENEEPADSELNLKIGYKPKKESLHLNYGNMSVPALRQLAKERGLGGEDADLQKLKKKDLVQLLQPH